MNCYTSCLNNDLTNLGHIMDKHMLDITKFFRTRDNRLEVCLVGICICFSQHVQQYSPSIPVTSKNRVMWICDKIKEAMDNQSVSFIVLDCRMENYFVNVIARDIIDSLDLQPKKVLILTATEPKDIFNGYDYIVDYTSFIDWGHSFTNLINRCIDWENIEIEIPIVSLVGRPTETRARLTKDLLNLCGDRARVSFGNLLQFPITDKERNLYSTILHPYPLPLRQNTDTKFLEHPEDIDDQVGYNLFQSIINIVNETNEFDSDTIMLSEKTFKALAWHQIPIFNATKGHVNVVRSLGVDTFDDIINHSYDSAPNNHIHKIKLLNEIAKFLKKYPTLEDLKELRKSIFHRLKYNNDLITNLYQNRKYEAWPWF